MDLSKIACRRLAMLFACCGIMAQLAAASPAMELPLAVPGSPKPPADAPAGGSDATQGANEELVALKAKLQTATQAFETLKKELAPRLAEAENTIQYVSTALEKAREPQETKRLEEELRLAGEWQTLLQGELALAEEEIQVAEGLLQMPQKREVLAVEKSQFEAELRSRSFSPQDAKMATTEARVATEKAALARGKAEMYQGELLSLEKEAADLKFEASKMAQELANIGEEVATPEASTAETSHAYELRLARRRAEIALKKAEIAQKQFEVIRGRYELAKQETDLFALQSEATEERAKSIRSTVGLSLEDLRAEEEQAAAAQQVAQTEKQKAQQEQVMAQEEREKAQQALQLARTAKQQATTEAQLRVADIKQGVAERQAELAQKKAGLAKEKVEVAGVAAEIAQRRLGLTTRKLEVERKTLTAAEILSNYEVAKGEAARAVKTAQSAQANAELARRELEAFKREAELAQLKVQAEKSQPGYPTSDTLARDTVAALEEGARVAAERGQVAEEWAAMLQERARLAAERAQISTDLEQLLGQHRATYQLWKRDPSKITWNALEEVFTDLVVLRSALILGVSTLPAHLGALLDSLLHPARYWQLLQHSLGAALCFMVAAFAAVVVRRRLQPIIVRQAQWFLPAPRRKLLRAATRLLQAVVLPLSLLFAGVLIFQFAAVGKPLFAAIVVALAGVTAYRLLTSTAQELFKPWDPPQRLINCRDGIATYLYRHLHRIILYVSIFLTIIYILEVIHYHEGAIALLRLTCDLGLLGLFILMAYNKEAIVSLLPNAENRLEKTIYVTVTQVYPLLVLFLICIVALSNLGYVNLARFLASSCALTAVILIVAHFICKGLDRLLHWGLISRSRMEADFVFGQETRETLYLILTHGLSYLVHIAAIVVIAGTWGVDLSGIYATLTSDRARDYYQRLGAVVLIIGFSTLFLRSTYYLIDKVFNLSAAEARAWRRKIALGDKGRTVAPLLKSLLKYGTIFVAAVLVLRALGVDPTPIIAGAGVIGLAVGFGAQTLVKDVISGFFLLFEGVIAVGDVITFGNSTGVVEEVGLRVTKYRTFSGELWVIPNGEIRAFGNHNRQWMRAIVTVGVAYEQDVVKAMHILEEVGKTWATEHQDIVLEAPAVQGILSFDDSAVALRLVVKVPPSQQGTAEWELRRLIKEAFDREGVKIPIPRRVFITRQEPNGVNGEEQQLALLPKRVQKVEESTGPAEK
jgi:small-conductance mechanosensitive channel